MVWWVIYIDKLKEVKLYKISSFLKKIYFEREKEHEQGRGRGGERESQAGFTLLAQSLMWGSIPWTVGSWPEPKPRVRCLTNWAIHPPQIMLLDWNGMQWKISKRKKSRKSPSFWKLSNIRLNNVWVKEVSKDISKYFELNKNTLLRNHV